MLLARAGLVFGLGFLMVGCSGSNITPASQGDGELFAPLMRIDQEPIGANCANGGLALHVGQDEDGDGVLDDTEITTTEYLCHGTSAMPTPLVEAQAEPAGGNCQYGGTAVHSGLDLDGDGILDAEEIISTSYACDSSPDARQLLVRVDEEPPGENCDNGGLAISTGFDADSDGELDVGEFAHTSYLCNSDDAETDVVGGTLEGSVTIRNSLDAAMFASFSRITGTLVVEAPGLTSLSLPLLEAVDGSLVVQSNDALTELSFGSLLSVGGDLGVLSNKGLADIADFIHLDTVGGSISIRGNDGMTDVSGFVSLQQIGADLDIRHNDDLQSISGFPAVASVANDLWVVDNLSLPLPAAEALRDRIGTIGGNTYFALPGDAAGSGDSPDQGDYQVGDPN